VGDVIRRVTGQTTGEYVRQQIAGPLQASLFIGLPKDQEGRVAPALLPDADIRQVRLADSGPYALRAVGWISPPLTPTAINRRDARAAEIPPPTASRMSDPRRGCLQR
jgi:CubicO group peptidase (beta-lactamase class C family)